MSRKRPCGQAPAAPSFVHVPVRPRLDGWTPARQVAFIEALSETGVVADACKIVGMSVESAYRLVRRPDAQSFRLAWQTAMDNAVHRVADAAIGRAIHGVPVPHYFQGEKIGEHRRFDERLTMFILRNRAPATFGDALVKEPTDQDPESIAIAMSDALRWVLRDALCELAGEARTTIRDIPPLGEDFNRAKVRAALARSRRARALLNERMADEVERTGVDHAGWFRDPEEEDAHGQPSAPEGQGGDVA